jgi:hypothetical protein
MNRFWDTIANDNKPPLGKDIRWETVLFGIRKCTETQLMKDKNGIDYCVKEDGLFHNIDFFINRNKHLYKQSTYDKLGEFYRPDLVVHFGLTVDQMHERLLRRKNKTFLEKGLDVEQLKSFPYI